MDDYKLWKVGDIVTKDGTDKHKIISIDCYWEQFEVECICEPTEPWIRLGEKEINLMHKYSLIQKFNNKKEK